MAKRKRLAPIGPGHLPAAPQDETSALHADDAPGSQFPGPTQRRAPIADVAADVAARAALDEMSTSLIRARDSGRMVIEIPLDEIRDDYISRDRMVLDPEEQAALMDSLRARGQQTPIEVVSLPDSGGYGLLSGWRRCQALRALHAETGDARYAKALVLLRQPEDIAQAYLSMVEENEIRANLSYYERAHIVVESVDQGVFETDRAALSHLFGSATRPRRSKIGSFLPIVRALDGALRFPDAMTERLGLVLSRALKEDAGLQGRLRAALTARPPTDATEEQATLKAVLEEKKQSLSAATGTHSTQKEANVEALPGLNVTQRRDGSLMLSGPRMDDALRRDLMAWLRDRTGG
ncbi:Chromosome segregation protein Spo0J, contains ParB-like nuclease domain [Salinihabitans flavidus]|uniref:Chromosome segregation protein Spo0J, contains ParB-like nuclease domain n=1 Tax=Salinihabitans flavidus TaxID=569882 RepID=A0A1H8V1K9_9RHOB|nr:ParB N-terminal domain-containing protein [Salinihabitans flavidus]SEP09133.1 Chromosome segregation protein Spo0J, contains ParB-like nuclease domain [Salinihabitans flavidus]